MWNHHTKYWTTTEPYTTNIASWLSIFRNSDQFIRCQGCLQFHKQPEIYNFKARKLYLTYLKRFFQGFGGNRLYLCRTPQGLEAFWHNRFGKTMSELYSFHLFSFYFPPSLCFLGTSISPPWLQVTIDSNHLHHSSFTAMHTKEQVSWRQRICMITLKSHSCMKTRICTEMRWEPRGVITVPSTFYQPCSKIHCYCFRS